MKDNKIINSQAPELRKGLLWLIFFRVIVTTFFMGATVLVHLQEKEFTFSPLFSYLYFLIGITYFLTFVYSLAINRVKNLKAFAYIQLIGDIVFIAGVVHVTGGSESIFSFLYTLTIIIGSILLYRRGGFVIASISGVTYGVYLNLEYYQIISPLFSRISGSYSLYRTDRIFYNIIVNIVAFYLVALLSSFLSEQERKTKEELKKKEIDFSRLKVLHGNIVQSIGSGILTIDSEGKITSFNKAAEQITGYTLDQVYYQKIEEVFSESFKEAKIFQKIFEDHSSFNRLEAPFNRPDGVFAFLGLSAFPLKDGRKISGKILIFQDLTKFKAMEEQIKRMDRLAAIGEMAAGIAHEIRNPLASMSGSIQILKDELNPDQDNRQLMDIVLKEANRLNRLITDFFLFTHPGERERENVNLSSVMDETIKMLINSPEWKKDMKIQTDLPEDITVEANSQQIKQILWNLLLNAAQAITQKGELKIKMQRTNSASKSQEFTGESIASEFVNISIADNGMGISQEKRKKIFDPFFTTKKEGTGLGLSIVYRIIENYQGNITVTSEENKGTEFIVSLPIKSDKSLVGKA